MNYIGLDFGTTNTRVATSGAPWRSPETGEGLMPSAVAFLPSGEVRVGSEAKARLPIDPANVVLGPKRILGVSYLSHQARQYDDGHGVTLVDRNGMAAIQTRSGIRTPDQLCSIIIHTIMSRASIVPSDTTIALTVPAGFGDHRRRCLLAICRGLGFTKVHLMREPVATGIAYLGRSNIRRAAVYDLGGGTFDIAIIGHDNTVGGLQVFETGGDDTIGGDDIDAALANWAADTVLARTGWDLKSEKTVFGRLVAAAERAKLTLWRQPTATIEPTDVDDATPIPLPPLTVTRQLLFELAFPLLQKTFAVCDEVLGRAGLAPSGLDAVFLAGGGTLLHGFPEAISRYFGKQARADIDPGYVVSIGASLAMARPALRHLLLYYDE